MRNILVTGGAGFIGSHTVVELAKSGYRPVIVDNFSNSDEAVITRLEKILGGAVAYYKQDFQDLEKLRAVVEKEAVSGVIHFAAYKAVSESVKDPLKYYQNNVGGLIQLLRYVEQSPLEQFVFSSSCTVYGEPDKLPVDESSPVKPAESPYGATKQMGETILCDSIFAGDSLSGMSLRYFNPIGAHPSALIGELPIGVPANLVPFITQTAAGLRDSLTVHGNDYDTPDGTCVRDYIHVVDLAKAHVKALTYLEGKSSPFYDAINIGTGTGSSVMEVIKTFEQATGQKLAYKIGPRRSGDVVSTYASVDKARRELGWTAEKNLADALSDAWRWQQTLQDNSSK
jgi:UDP-glucose 4-epimerase